MSNQQSPKPPVVVGGWGSPSIPLNRTITGTINYEYRYPSDFPEDARAAIKLEEIRAEREFNEKSKDVSERELRPMLLGCAMRPALAFAREMMRLHWYRLPHARVCPRGSGLGCRATQNLRRRPNGGNMRTNCLGYPN